MRMNPFKFVPTCLFIIVSLVFLFSNTLEAKIYKWVDEQGKTHFTDDPSKVPSKSKLKVYLPSTKPTVSRKEIKNSDFNIGIIAYKNGDYQTAFDKLTPLAKTGNVGAQSALGMMYHSGKGVAQDYSEAFKWLSLAAKQGLAPAQGVVGGMYLHGRGINQDSKKAVKWYSLAAKQGDALSQHNLGIMYANELGVARDYVEAHKWFNIAGANGHKKGRETVVLLEKKMTLKLNKKFDSQNTLLFGFSTGGLRVPTFFIPPRNRNSP